MEYGDSFSYQASLGTGQKVITYGLSAFLGLGGPIAAALLKVPAPDSYYIILPSAIYWIIFFFTWLLHPRGYRIAANQLEILRPAGAKTYSLEGLADIKPIKTMNLFGTLGIFRSDGLWGIFGLAYKSGFGIFPMWVSNPANGLILLFHNRPVIVISPDDTLRLQEQIRLLLPGGSSE